jgi:hypothetical protein
MAGSRLYDGARAGQHTAVTPYSLSAHAAYRAIQRVVSLGTGAVATATRVVGVMPVAGRVTGIRISGQAAVAGTALTAEIYARGTAGGAGNTQQSAALDVKFASAAAAKTGVAAALTATDANLVLEAGQMFEVVITATAITAGPDDLLVAITFVPAEDERSGSQYVTGRDILS